jgi:hypothetical protein
MDSDDNIRMAFQSVKKDIMELKDQMLMITERQEKFEASTEDSKASPLVQINSDSKPAKKKVAKKKK